MTALFVIQFTRDSIWILFLFSISSQMNLREWKKKRTIWRAKKKEKKKKTHRFALFDTTNWIVYGYKCNNKNSV